MSDASRNRARRPGRRTPFRDPKQRILIVCEGKVTEKQYFEEFRRACRNPLVDIEIASEHGVPRTLVETAKRYKTEANEQASQAVDDNLAYDSVWCVFDVDEHPKISDAKEMARGNGIDVALSNPCFELWLLLHFRDNPGMQHRDKIQDMLTKHVPQYRKHVDYAKYAAGYPEAVKRAERMDRLAEEADEAGRNPTTGVYRLTELIRGEATSKP